MSRNYGDQFVDSVREYMKANEIDKVNWALLAELAQRFNDKLTVAQKTRKKQMCEEEWVKGLEANPIFHGIDIRKELGKCQFWCKERNMIPTRRRFSNWLLKAEKTVGVYDGQSSRPKKETVKPVFTPDTVVPGWPLLLRREIDTKDVPEEKLDQLCAGDWHDLPVDIREKIISVA